MPEPTTDDILRRMQSTSPEVIDLAEAVYNDALLSAAEHLPPGPAAAVRALTDRNPYTLFKETGRSGQ